MYSDVKGVQRSAVDGQRVQLQAPVQRESQSL